MNSYSLHQWRTHFLHRGCQMHWETLSTQSRSVPTSGRNVSLLSTLITGSWYFSNAPKSIQQICVEYRQAQCCKLSAAGVSKVRFCQRALPISFAEGISSLCYVAIVAVWRTVTCNRQNNYTRKEPPWVPMRKQAASKRGFCDFSPLLWRAVILLPRGRRKMRLWKDKSLSGIPGKLLKAVSASRPWSPALT